MALLLVTGSQGHREGQTPDLPTACVKSKKGELVSSFWWEVSLASLKQSYWRGGELFIQRLSL